MTSPPEGGERGGTGGVQKMALWGDFQGITRVTRGGSRVINYKNWGDVIYGWSLMEGPLNEKSVSPFSYHVELCLRYVSHHCRIISLISDAS